MTTGGYPLRQNTVSQNRLNAMKNNINSKKIISRVLGVTPRGLFLRKSFRSLQTLFKDTIGFKMGLLVEKLLKFNILLVFRA